MKKIIGFIAGAVGAITGVCAGKVIYEAFKDKKRIDVNRKKMFVDDIEDDFNEIAPGNVKEEPVVVTPNKVEEDKPAATAKPAAKKTPAKKASAKKAEPKAVEPAKKGGKYPSLTCQDVIDCTANVLDISTEDILSKSRKADVANARKIAIYISAVELGATSKTICEEFGGIGATSVTNAKKNIAEAIQSDDDTADNVADILSEMNSLEKSFNR